MDQEELVKLLRFGLPSVSEERREMMGLWSRFASHEVVRRRLKDRYEHVCPR